MANSDIQSEDRHDQAKLEDEGSFDVWSSLGATVGGIISRYAHEEWIITRRTEGRASLAICDMGRVILITKESMGNPTEDKDGSGRPKKVPSMESKTWKARRY